MSDEMERGQASGSERSITWVLRVGRDGAAEFFAKLGTSPAP